MSSTRFFALECGQCLDGSEFELYADDWTQTGPAPQCSLCGSFTGALSWIPPIRGELEAGKSFFDLARTFGDEVLLTERCWHLFAEKGLHGLVDPLPVEFVQSNGSPDLSIKEAYLLAKVQVGASVDRVRSGLKTSEERICPACGSAGMIESYERVAVDMKSWLGLDVLRLKGLPGTVLVTERVRTACAEAGLSICRLIPAEDDSMLP